MVTKTQFLRRSLLAPIAVPVAALLNGSFRAMQLSGGTDLNPFSGNDAFNQFMMGVFLCSLIFGSIPYLWMLSAKWAEFYKANEAELDRLVQNLPGTMVIYYWKIMGVLTLLSLISIIYAAGAIYLLIFLVIGTFAILILGYLYIGATYALLTVFQAAGLVTKTEQLA